MNLNEEPGSWEEKKGKLREKFDHLTEDDLQYETGKSDELFERLQSKLGVNSSEMANIIAAL